MKWDDLIPEIERRAASFCVTKECLARHILKKLKS